MKKGEKQAAASAWTDKWLTGVADGSATMSQRSLASLEERGGGLAVVRKAAKAKAVHLLLIEDDRGRRVVAASLKPFKVVC